MTNTNPILRFLFIEESQADLASLVRELERAGLTFIYEQAATMVDLREKFKEPWDTILSDSSLAGFSASDVLKLANEMHVTAPIIVVSGAVREEDAVDLMKLGAKDFVRKDNTARFVPAILRERKEAEQRRLRQNAEAALESNRELTSKILLRTQDCFFILDLQGRVAIASLSPNRNFFENQDAVGRNFADLWAQPEHRTLASQAYEQAAKGTPAKFVGLQNQADWWSLVISPMHEGSVITNLLAVARDISEERRIQEDFRLQAVELKKALHLAESANEMKTAFLANMSHEIRTPIGAMMGFAELLTDSGLSQDERTRFAYVVKRNGENLLRLLNEILDLSKIEAGHLEISIQETSLNLLVQDAIAAVQHRASEQGLELQLDAKINLEAAFKTDPVRLTQILTNLLGNAIKFTERGSVKLVVDSERVSEGEDGTRVDRELVRFLVVDTGVGISEDNQAKLFRPFSQGDNSFSRRFGGTGLGLALSRRLAEALGGSVVIHRSSIGKGSEFLAKIVNYAET